VNIYDISQRQDPNKAYSKTFNESKCKNWVEFNEKVEKQRRKLETGIFAHKGNFYYAKYEVINLSEVFEDEASNCTTTICRILKFKWTYQYLK